MGGMLAAMLLLYNLLQLLLLPLLLVFLGCLFCRGKYRRRLPARLGLMGYPLADSGPALPPGQSLPPSAGKAKTFWLHALSVGEVTSAAPLLAAIRESWPDGRLIVSVTTASGRLVAERLFDGLADRVIDGPIDLLPVVDHFIEEIGADIYILVETDFWPNLLGRLRQRGVATVLVNGRVSASSRAGYRRLALFFRPLFAGFSCLCLQTEEDRQAMARLGVPPERLHCPGNLKYATRTRLADQSEKIRLLPSGRLLLLAGSTHRGEEELLLRGCLELRANHPELFLLLAPRDPGRADEIAKLAGRLGWQHARRSENRPATADLLLIDTIGELIDFYALADIAFVGGSLVPCGGHNPLEPAALGVPVLFGRFMEDFSEIAAELVAAGGATQVADAAGLSRALTTLADSPAERARQGEAARQAVAKVGGVVVDRHIQLLRGLL